MLAWAKPWLVPAVDEAHPGQRAGSVGDLLGQSQPLPQAEDLAVAVHRPGQVVDRGPPLENHRLNASSAQEVGGGDPHRAASDHGHHGLAMEGLFIHR
jgi:hypothetical protein